MAKRTKRTRTKDSASRRKTSKTASGSRIDGYDFPIPKTAVELQAMLLSGLLEWKDNFLAENPLFAMYIRNQ